VLGETGAGPDFGGGGFGIEDPDFFDSGGEVLFELRVDGSRRFAGGEDFDGDVRDDGDHGGVG
jgi:hypothetical protein